MPSPTFTLVQPYATSRLDIFHFDLYRLTDPAEIDEIGFDEAVVSGLALVEWPERAGGRLLGHHLDIAISTQSSTEARIVTLTPDEHWRARLDRLTVLPDEPPRAVVIALDLQAAFMNSAMMEST